MRVGIFSDIHGNLPALEAVLADIAAQQPDLVYCHTVRDPTGCLATGSRSLPSSTGGRNGRSVCEKSPPGSANGAADGKRMGSGKLNEIALGLEPQRLS